MINIIFSQSMNGSPSLYTGHDGSLSWYDEGNCGCGVGAVVPNAGGTFCPVDVNGGIAVVLDVLNANVGFVDALWMLDDVLNVVVVGIAPVGNAFDV